MALDKAKIESKRAVLNGVKVQLKTEFFGLDTIIDKVIDSVSAWYIFPELITRPVIINLWGMTGVGKTQLVRRLVSLLDYGDKFVEVQMDGGSTSGYWANKLSSILSQSTIDEGEPGILLLDEIQRFRTVDDHGGDVKVERYQDVWTLLSDGKFSADSSAFAELEMMMINQNFEAGKIVPLTDLNDDEDEEEEEGRTKQKRQVMYPYEAKNLKKMLRLPHSIPDIMRMSSSEIMRLIENARSSRTSWEIDYSKLVIFISGNLDSAFSGSINTDDADTDADFYHEITKNISINDIKESLLTRFRPEQISRLGNNHIIYPSMSKKSYQQLITATCTKYIDEMAKVSDINFDLDQSVLDQIYDNAVFPTQGTRPVFSSIHKIFSNLLVNVAFWAIEHDLTDIKLQMTEDHKQIRAISSIERVFPIDLELNERKAKTSLDFKTVVGVHEVGHAAVYALLNQAAPFELKVNISSFRGGYMLPSPDDEAITKEQFLDNICVNLAGRAAEEVVFGENHATTGASQDIINATQSASAYCRRFGFDGLPAYIDSPNNNNITYLTAIADTDPVIRNIIMSQFERAKDLIVKNMPYVKHLTDVIIDRGSLSADDFIAESKPFLALKAEVEHFPFADKWLEFKGHHLKIVNE